MYFDSGGVRLRYYLSGPAHGRPVFLVHGFASDYELNWAGSRWEETLVKAGFRVMGLDCRGHGRSAKPHDIQAYARRLMADDAARLLDHLGVTEADYCGYSMGARIGLDLALRHPGRIHRMVLGGASLALASGPAPHAQAIARRLRGDLSETHPRAIMFYSFAASREINDLEALACCILGDQPPLGEDRLASLKLPVAVVTGDQDELALDASQLAALLPAGHFVSVAGRNHMNVITAYPFKQAALDFLSD
jgi:pimeloyl-ACP methyl ester carboxylesterase